MTRQSSNSESEPFKFQPQSPNFALLLKEIFKTNGTLSSIFCEQFTSAQFDENALKNELDSCTKSELQRLEFFDIFFTSLSQKQFHTFSRECIAIICGFENSDIFFTRFMKAITRILNHTNKSVKDIPKEKEKQNYNIKDDSDDSCSEQSDISLTDRIENQKKKSNAFSEGRNQNIQHQYSSLSYNSSKQINQQTIITPGQILNESQQGIKLGIINPPTLHGSTNIIPTTSYTIIEVKRSQNESIQQPIFNAIQQPLFILTTPSQLRTRCLSCIYQLLISGNDDIESRAIVEYILTAQQIKQIQSSQTTSQHSSGQQIEVYSEELISYIMQIIQKPQSSDYLILSRQTIPNPINFQSSQHNSSSSKYIDIFPAQHLHILFSFRIMAFLVAHACLSPTGSAAPIIARVLSIGSKNALILAEQERIKTQIQKQPQQQILGPFQIQKTKDESHSNIKIKKYTEFLPSESYYKQILSCINNIFTREIARRSLSVLTSHQNKQNLLNKSINQETNEQDWMLIPFDVGCAVILTYGLLCNSKEFNSWIMKNLRAEFDANINYIKQNDSIKLGVSIRTNQTEIFDQETIQIIKGFFVSLVELYSFLIHSPPFVNPSNHNIHSQYQQHNKHDSSQSEQTTHSQLYRCIQLLQSACLCAAEDGNVSRCLIVIDPSSNTYNQDQPQKTLLQNPYSSQSSTNSQYEQQENQISNIYSPSIQICLLHIAPLNIFQSIWNQTASQFTRAVDMGKSAVSSVFNLISKSRKDKQNKDQDEIEEQSDVQLKLRPQSTISHLHSESLQQPTSISLTRISGQTSIACALLISSAEQVTISIRNGFGEVEYIQKALLCIHKIFSTALFLGKNFIKHQNNEIRQQNNMSCFPSLSSTENLNSNKETNSQDQQIDSSVAQEKQLWQSIWNSLSSALAYFSEIITQTLQSLNIQINDQFSQLQLNAISTKTLQCVELIIITLNQLFTYNKAFIQSDEVRQQMFNELVIDQSDSNLQNVYKNTEQIRLQSQNVIVQFGDQPSSIFQSQSQTLKPSPIQHNLHPINQNSVSQNNGQWQSLSDTAAIFLDTICKLLDGKQNTNDNANPNQQINSDPKMIIGLSHVHSYNEISILRSFVRDIFSQNSF